jgi:hypothetical protein
LGTLFEKILVESKFKLIRPIESLETEILFSSFPLIDIVVDIITILLFVERAEIDYVRKSLIGMESTNGD